jgi:hypothetical protein
MAWQPQICMAGLSEIPSIARLTVLLSLTRSQVFNFAVMHLHRGNLWIPEPEK